MDLLTKFLLKEVLDNQKVVAIYGGGFKPPTKGHFAVAKKTLDDFPEIDELKIFVGGGVRDGITQDESIKIWTIYKSLLPDKIDVEPSVAPVKSVLGYAKDHPEEKVYWILGAREGDEDDLKDIESRTRSIDKYPNIEVKVITTTGGVSGTKTRQAIRDNNKEQFFHMIPDVSDEEKEQIWDMTSTVIKEELLKEEALIDKLKNKLKTLINAVKQESKETKQAFSLLIKSAKGDIELTDLQQQFIKEQMVDLLKSLGLVTLAIMPAGSLVALLLKALKLSSYVTPSAFINEIGEANLKPYKWEEVDVEGYFVYTRFTTDNETQYDVDIKSTVYYPPGQMDSVPALEIEFSAKPKGAEGSSAKIVVNKGEMYRVMATIVNIIKKYIKKSRAEAIIYSPSKKSDEETFGTQRDNLYRAFISKAFPETTFKQSGDNITAILPNNAALTLDEADPKKGTGKKPKGSSRRLYTDEDPKDTVGISFKTKEDIVDTLNKTSFKAKSHARQSQIINLIHQRVRAAYGKAKDPEVKARLKRGLDYIESRKESSKKKTERLRKQKTNENQQTGLDTFDRLDYYKNYFINVSPSTFDITTDSENIIISGINNPYPKNFNDVEDTIQVPVISENIDSNNLEELTTTISAPIKESYQFKLTDKDYDEEDKSLLSADYKFSTPNNDYRVEFYSGEYSPESKTFDLSFGLDAGYTNKLDTFQMTGEGNALSILKTIINIIKDFTNRFDVNKLVINPTSEKRGKVYSMILKSLPTNILNKIEIIQETVTATQVICDNCGWEWAIKDGGDDLYICHKCGHDNTPESDLFGLNELAKQFGEEVGRDLTKGWNPQKDFVSLSIFMIDNGMNIKPLPKIKVIKDDKENASNLLGKTAYYDPSNKSITLYTFGRHPKDILRSFAHEMIHHEQNLNGKLGNITTTNTNEDGDLPEIEKEAYEKGNMMLRNWEDSIKNPVKEHILYIPKFNKPLTLTENLWKTLNEISLNPNNAAELEGDLYKGMFKAGDKTYTYDIYRIENPYEDGKEFYNVEFHPKNNPISTPTGDTTKEDYIKILNTMYKIILDFAEADEPDYIGIASMEGSSNKNYHKVYNNLTDNKFNNIPGYFRKDANLEFDTPQGKGRFVVLKRKNV
jgi:hypothetical protein